MALKIKYFIFVAILISSNILQSQNIFEKGDSLEFNLKGYSYGQINWQNSFDNINWLDIQNETDSLLKIKANKTSFYRSKVVSCNDTYYSESSKIEVPENEYEYVDFVGKYLASDELRGRKPGTRGDSLSAFYISKLFEKSHLTKLNSPTFYKPFNTPKNGTTFNVIGLIPGHDDVLKNEVIVISGHYDHLGANGNAIYNGADDNVSGTVAVCLLARKLKDIKSKRTILFITPGGEEIGQIGTINFITSKEIPISKIKYVFNFDMIGRLIEDSLSFYGTKYNKDLIPLIINQNSANLNLAFPNMPFFNGSTSDHAIYTAYGGNNVSAFGITTGKHSDYHRTTDDWDKININGIIKITDLTYKIVEKLALDN